MLVENFFGGFNRARQVQGEMPDEVHPPLASRAASLFFQYVLHSVKVQSSLLWASKNLFSQALSYVFPSVYRFFLLSPFFKFVFCFFLRTLRDLHRVWPCGARVTLGE